MLWLLVAAGPSPSPTSKVDPNLVTPGVWGFAIFAFVAICAVLLGIDLVRRVRRVRYRAEIQARLAAEAGAGKSDDVT